MTSWISIAPAFSIESESSMDQAILTPSLITLSDPDSERITLRPAYFHLKSIPISNEQHEI